MGETGRVTIQKRAYNVDVSPQFNGYSMVRIFVGKTDEGKDIVYEAGNTSGHVLEMYNDFGTQAMANNILTAIRGYQYQPLSIEGGMVDPSAELGDGITANLVYSGIFSRTTQFGRLMASEIVAPSDEEIVHEYGVISPENRQFIRMQGEMKSGIYLTRQYIDLQVSNEAEERSAEIKLTKDGIETDIAAGVKGAKDYADNRITVSANGIKAVIAASGTYYYESTQKFDLYGYGHPTSAGYQPSSYRNKYYLNKSNGSWYQSNGTSWVYKGTLQTAQTKIQATADGLSAEIKRAEKVEGGLSSSISTVSQTASSLKTQISNETTRAQGAESSLSSSISEVKQTADGFSTRISSLESSQSTLSNSVSSLTQTSNDISARVTTVESNKLDGTYNNSSFGWNLTSSSFSINSSGNKNIFYANRDGIKIGGNAEVTGEITATSGYIGSKDYGFEIGTTFIRNGKTNLTDRNDGVYIGTDGIALGPDGAFSVTKYGVISAKNLNIVGGTINIGEEYGGTYAFSVDQYGELTAKSGRFEGTVYAGGIISDYDERGAGVISGATYGPIELESIDTGVVNGGINTSLGYADFSNDVFNYADFASNVCCWQLVLRSNPYGYYQDEAIAMNTVSFVDGNGDVIKLRGLLFQTY